MFKITYFNRRLGKAVEAKFDSYDEAKQVAEDIFQNLGIVVGIENA